MTQHVLFIHGGGQGAYQEGKKLAQSLREALGTDYHVRYPQMPNEDRPEYEAWSTNIAEELATLGEDVILVGHSFGASVLSKYLFEETPAKPVAGAFLIAAPYWGTEDWQVDEYGLREDFASRLLQGLPIVFHGGRDDEVVPFEHLARYRKRLPKATVRELEGHGHGFNDEANDVAEDIRGLFT